MAGGTAGDRRPDARVLELARGYMVSQAVYVTAKLAVADLIAGGVTDLDGLAASSGVDRDALRRLLRLLCDLDLVAGDDTDGYRLTESGGCLRSDHGTSVRNMVILHGEEHYRAWSELLHSVRTGESAMERVLGQPMFSYLDDNPAAAASFNRGMADLARTMLLPALSAIDVDGATTVADVGGGTGSVLAHLLRRHHRLRGILFDRPEVVGDALPELHAGELADRCRLVGGDFFTEVPDGADIYLLARVLHDFDDQQVTRLLERVRAVAPAHGSLVVLERVLPGDGHPHPGHPHPGHLQDLNMLVVNGGRERTLDEYRHLLAAAGFRLQRVTAVPDALDVLVAVPG